MLCSTVAEASRLPATAPMAFRTACSSAAHSPVRSLGHTRAHCPTVPRFSTSQARFPGAAPYKVTLSSARTDLRKCTEPRQRQYDCQHRSRARHSRIVRNWIGWLGCSSQKEIIHGRIHAAALTVAAEICVFCASSPRRPHFDHGHTFHRLPRPVNCLETHFLTSASPDEVIRPRLSTAKEDGHAPQGLPPRPPPNNRAQTTRPRSRSQSRYRRGPARPRKPCFTCCSGKSLTRSAFLQAHCRIRGAPSPRQTRRIHFSCRW